MDSGTFDLTNDIFDPEYAYLNEDLLGMFNEDKSFALKF